MSWNTWVLSAHSPQQAPAAYTRKRKVPGLKVFLRFLMAYQGRINSVGNQLP